MFLDIIHHLVYFLKIVLFPFKNTMFLRLDSPEIGTSSLYWTQVSRFHLRMGTESSPETLCFKKKQDAFYKIV
jgi:hypothetical protein